MYFARFGNRGSDASDAFRNAFRDFASSIHPSSRVRRCQNKTERRSRFGVSGRARPAGDAARDDGGRNECDAFGSRRFAATATRGADDARRDRDEGCDRDRASIVSGVYLGGKPPEKNLPLGAGRGSRARRAHRVREEKRARMTDSECIDRSFATSRLRSSTCSRGKRRRKPSSRCRCVRKDIALESRARRRRD